MVYRSISLFPKSGFIFQCSISDFQLNVTHYQEKLNPVYLNSNFIISIKLWIDTVPFKSIRQSRVTRPSKTLKCHGGHGNFCKVLNSFSDHVPNIEIFHRLRRKTAENFPKIWTCHGKFGRLPKPKFWQACHRSHPLPN